MSQYFPKPYERSDGDIKVELYPPNCATKDDLKGVTSNLATKSDLATVKAVVDKIDIDKLRTVPADLSKLSNVVGNDIVKKICV